MVRTIETGKAQLILDLNRAAMVHIQVLDTPPVRLSTNKDTLETLNGSTKGGLLLQQSDGIETLYWKGPLYAISDGATATIVNIESPASEV